MSGERPIKLLISVMNKMIRESFSGFISAETQNCCIRQSGVCDGCIWRQVTFPHAHGMLGSCYGMKPTHPQDGLHAETNDGHGCRPPVDLRSGLCWNGDSGGRRRINRGPQSPDAIKSALEQQVGKRVRVKLESGQDLDGKVATVGSYVVQLAELTGMNHFDATVKLDEIAAVIVKVRTK